MNKALIAICTLLLPIAVIGSYQTAKNQLPTAKPSAYSLVDTVIPAVTPDPLNPNSKAEVLIEAPTQAKIGQLVRFDLSKSSGSMFQWKVIPTSTNFETYEGGRKAVFSADMPGDYTFVIAAALNGTVDVKTIVLKVTSSSTVPAPAPAPSPTSALSAKVKAWADAVSTTTKKTEAVKLSDSFNSVAQQITASALTTPEDIITKTAEMNRTVLGTSLSAWVPFLTNLQAEMKTRASSGQLTTPEQHATLWSEIARALKEYGTSTN